MCKQSLPVVFILISFLMLILIFGLALTNMIISKQTPKQLETFIERNITDDYNNISTYDFLMDLNFGTELRLKNDYDILEYIKRICYKGICNLDSSNKYSDNCSQACLASSKLCYDGENICKTISCNEVDYYSYESHAACHYFNRIQLWRNTEFLRNTETYRVTPYVDIVPKNKNCRFGYKKCGIINENKDYLCLKNDKEYECPINDIIVKTKNESIEEGYQSFKLGDKYIFISHDKTDNYLIKNLSITLNTDKKSSNLIELDNESFENLSSYNYISLDNIFQPETAFLNAVPFKSNYTYEQMMKDQEIIDKKRETFTKEKINEFNSEVIQYKELLYGLGIALFVTTCVYSVIIYPIYCCDCSSDPSCRNCSFLCSDDFSPCKHVLGFYIIGLPIAILLIISFSLTITKKSTYNKLSSIDYIEEYKNCSRYVRLYTCYDDDDYYSYRYDDCYEEYYYYFDYFEKSIIYNNVQFILLLIILILIILYPIVIICLYGNYIGETDRFYAYKKKSSEDQSTELCQKPTPTYDIIETPS